MILKKYLRRLDTTQLIQNATKITECSDSLFKKKLIITIDN